MRALLRSLARAPWFRGYARTLDISGALNEPMPYERVGDSAAADALAIHRDWMAVGDDLRNAMVHVGRES